MSEDEVVATGLRLIKIWECATKAVEIAESRLVKHKFDANRAEQELAKWLLPHDHAPCEKIAVWHGNELIQVVAGMPGMKHRVTMRPASISRKEAVKKENTA